MKFQPRPEPHEFKTADRYKTALWVWQQAQVVEAREKAAQTASQPRGATIRTKPDQPERREQEAIKRLLAAIGAKFYVAGVTRKKGDYHGTMQTPGLPDMPLVFLPLYKCYIDSKTDRQHLSPGQAESRGLPIYELVCIEVKSPAAAKLKWGGLTPEQRGVKAYCVGAGVPYIHGTCNDVIDWLITHGYCRANQFPHYRLAKPPDPA